MVGKAIIMAFRERYLPASPENEKSPVNSGPQNPSKEIRVNASYQVK
jgi:hypothetical protein